MSIEKQLWKTYQDMTVSFVSEKKDSKDKTNYYFVIDENNEIFLLILDLTVLRTICSH